MDFKFRTLYLINPKDYNEMFSLPSNRKKKVETYRKINNENNYKNSDSNIYTLYNKIQDKNYNSNFRFYKTDTIPFPNFPKKKKLKKFSTHQLFTSKITKKKNNFSIKYIELLKDINNERKLKNYYILKGNNKLKYIKDGGLKLIKIIFENDIETITRSVISLNNMKQKINSNINPKSLVQSIYNENKKNSNSQTSNIFFKDILNDIYRQIEICNKNNNQVDIVLVKNLLVIELNKIEKDFKNLNKYIKHLLEDNVIEETEEFIKKHKKHRKNDDNQLSSSSSSSSFKEKKYNLFGKEYLQMLFRNKIKGYVKNFKNYNPNNVVSSIGTKVNSNNFRPIITNYKNKKQNYFIKNSNQHIQNELNISNHKEKDFEMKDSQHNIYQSNNNELINDNIHSYRNNTYNNIIQEKKSIQDKIGNINTEMDNNVIYSSGYFNKINYPFVNNSLLNSNINNDIDIKETMTIPVNSKNINNNEKSISPINKMEKYAKKINDNFILNSYKNDFININSNNNNIAQNDYNFQKKMSKIDSKKEKDGGLNFSMMKIFEQLIKNDTIRTKTIKKTGTKNEQKAFERKKSQLKIELKSNFEKRKSVIEENIINEYTKKLLNTPGITLTKEEIMEEVNNIKKEMLKSKNLSVKGTASSKKKKKIITKEGLNELKEKLVLINHVDQMNMNREQKEEFLNHIFEYKFLLNKANKTEDELIKEKEIRYKLRSIIEKYLFELQKRELINTKSIYSKKKNILKNKLRFLKDLKLNIFGDEEKIEEFIDNPPKKEEKDKAGNQEKILLELNENNNINTLDELLKMTKVEKKKEKKLIYDNSYMFSKHEKNVEIRDEVLKIMNTNYALVNDNNNSNTSTINDKSSYYSSNNRKMKQKKKFKKKNQNVSRRTSIIDINESIEKKKLIEKKNEEERIRREEEEEEIRKKKEMEDIQKREEIFDKKLYEFFDKIKKMKNHDGNYEDELEKLIDEKAYNLDDAKEMRINSFIHKLRLNREKEKFFSKFHNKRLGYSSPLIFTMNNFYPKKKILFRSNNINNEDNLYRTEYINKNDK